MKIFLGCLAAVVLLSVGTTIPVLDAALQTKPKETQEGIQDIKVKTELMEVRAVVTDAKGRIIEDLKKEDFELLENDRPQEIGFFSVSQVEAERSGQSSAVPGTKQQASEPAPAEAGAQDRAAALQRARGRLSESPVRTTLLYVDNLHLTFGSLNRVKEALRRFIKERLTEQDVVAVATSGQTLGAAQQFTRDRQILNYAIEQIRFAPGRHEDAFPPTLAAGVVAERPDAMRLGVDIMRRKWNIDKPCESLVRRAHVEALNILSEASFSRKNTLSILKDFSEQMVGLPGKRMIVVFSDGFTLHDNDAGIHTEQLQAAIDRAVRSGVVIYSIDAKGLQGLPTLDASKPWSMTDPGLHPWVNPTGTQPSAASTEAAGLGDEDPENPDPRCLAPDPGLWTSFTSLSEREEQNGLYDMAEQTGGKMYADTNNLGDALGRAFDANRFYYVLSYYLPSGIEDRRFRGIKVRVRNHPEYIIRTAKGFSVLDSKSTLEADAARTPQQRLIQAMRTPLPVTDLGVSAVADFLETETDDKQVSLTVYFDGDRFKYQEKDQRSAVELEIISAVYDSSGKQVDGISAHVEGKLTAERLAQAKTSGYRFARRLSLKSGVYQVRIGVREEGTDRMGTAAAWVEVPGFARDKLEMSSLMLRNPLDSDPGEKEGINVSELEQVKMVQGIPLYGRTDFCDYYFRVHQVAQAAAVSELATMTELLKGGKPVKQESWRPIPAEERNADSKGWFDLDGEVDFSGLDAGVYELRVSVKDAKSNKTIQRSAVFSLE
jgi:VWFA-related protein